MENDLENKLFKLETERLALKRNINSNYFNKKVRKNLFLRLNDVNQEIMKIKFKIKMENKCEKLR